MFIAICLESKNKIVVETMSSTMFKKHNCNKHQSDKLELEKFVLCMKRYVNNFFSML